MINWIRGWWDEVCDRYYDNSDNWGRSLNDVPFWKWRWRIAEFYNKHTPRCWSVMCDFALGNSIRLGGEDVTSCRESAIKLGACYCGKYISEEAAKIVPNPDERIVVKQP